MSCSDSVNVIARMLEGSLCPEETEELKGHLSVCSACRAELAFQKKIIESLKQELPSTLPADFAERVSTRAFAAAKHAERGYRLRILAPVFAAGIVAVIVFLLRTQIASIIPEGAQAATDGIAAPLAWAGQRFLDLLAKLPRVGTEDLAGVEWLHQLLMNTLVGAGMAIAVALWGFRRALAFMRE
jgi:anti-sigma factor RsiW